MTPDKFWSQVDKRGLDECWVWLGHVTEKGYGRVTGRVNGKRGSFRAHRIAYLYAKSDPTGFLVLHNCDNRACVNPAHLRLGNHADNMRDMAERNPFPRMIGSSNRASKLTEAQVAEMKAEYSATRWGDLRAASRRYGVDRCTITRILRGTAWKHVKPAAADAGGATGRPPSPIDTPFEEPRT